MQPHNVSGSPYGRGNESGLPLLLERDRPQEIGESKVISNIASLNASMDRS